tara:strand:- start:286 stop:666 length:381 start_codon:yes stop_codon:yes gene_type:complete
MANINSGTIKSVLSLTSRNVTNDILNLRVNDTLVVLEDVVQKRAVLSTVASLLVPSADFTKSYVFVNNVSTSNITLVRANNGDEYMHLAPGQWAWFPWSCSVDLMAEAASGTPTLEVMIFELGHNN